MKTLYIILLAAILICGCGSVKTPTPTGNETPTPAPASEVAVVEESEKSEPESQEVPSVVEEPEDVYGPWDDWGFPDVDREFRKTLYYGNYQLLTVYNDDNGEHYVITRHKAIETCKCDEIDAAGERAKELFLSFVDDFELPLELEYVEPINGDRALRDPSEFDLEGTGCWGQIWEITKDDVVRRSVNKESMIENISIDDTERELGYIPTFTCKYVP